MDPDTEAALLQQSSHQPPAVNYATKPQYSQWGESNPHNNPQSIPELDGRSVQELDGRSVQELDGRSVQELDGRSVQRHPSCLRIGYDTGGNNTRFDEDFLGLLIQESSTAQQHTGGTPELDVNRPTTPELQGREVSRPRYLESVEAFSGCDAESMYVNTSTNTVDEMPIQKQGLNGRLWLGFHNLNNKLDKIYVKYHDLGKRKLYWNLWERHRETSKFSSYAEFKKEWNPNDSIWRSIAKEINSDIKKEVNDLVSRKRPFDSNISNVNRATINNHRHHYRHHRRHRTR